MEIPDGRVELTDLEPVRRLRAIHGLNSVFSVFLL